MLTVRKRTAGIVSDYLYELGAVLSRLPVEDVERAVGAIAQARDEGRRVFIFGNGGSAATASHFVCDLAKGAARKDKPRIRAMALTDSLPIITALANDQDYEDIFCEQLDNHVEFGDVVIAISGSGNSRNVLKAVSVAHEKGATTIGLTAFDGGQLKQMVDIAVVVPTRKMEQAEDAHLVLEHVIAICLREAEDV